MGNDLLKLDIETILEYIAKWESDLANEKYALYYNGLTRLFSEKTNDHNSINDVIIKVAALDNLFSTNVIHKNVVAEKIININNFDDRVREGCPALVDELKSIKFGEKYRKLYSFASKYCHFHNVDAYPIYDSHVDRTLRLYNKEYRFIDCCNKSIKDYAVFKLYIKTFSEKFGLLELSVRELDKFLWIYGKQLRVKKG